MPGGGARLDVLQWTPLASPGSLPAQVPLVTTNCPRPMLAASHLEPYSQHRAIWPLGGCVTMPGDIFHCHSERDAAGI